MPSTHSRLRAIISRVRGLRMITIQVLGLDQFVVGHYSKEHTANIAQLLEVPEEEVNFYAPNAMMFHSGVEQTSWSTLVNVLLPHRFEALEKPLADYIMRTLCEFSIHVTVTFTYYHDHSEYNYVNPQYPRYLKGENIKEADISVEYGMPHDEDECDEDECECHHSHDSEEEDDIYLGNAFEGLEETLDHKGKDN